MTLVETSQIMSENGEQFVVARFAPLHLFRLWPSGFVHRTGLLSSSVAFILEREPNTHGNALLWQSHCTQPQTTTWTAYSAFPTYSTVVASLWTDWRLVVVFLLARNGLFNRSLAWCNLTSKTLTLTLVLIPCEN